MDERDQLNKVENPNNVAGESSKHSIKALIPQVSAAIVVHCFNMLSGLAIAYSAILISQLQAAQKSAQNLYDVIQVTESDSAWISSVLLIASPVTSIICGFCIDYIGRLNMLKIAIIPNCVGWGLIAAAKNVPTLIIGRLLCGIAITLGTSSTMVYVTEISNPNIRGSLLSLGSTAASVGTLLGYVHGWYLNWRMYALLVSIYSGVLGLTIMLFLMESPSWLVSKGRSTEAKKSLTWFNRYAVSTKNIETFVEVELTGIEFNNQLKQAGHSKMETKVTDYVKAFSKPTVYKPLVFLGILYVFYSLSGIYMTLFYAISFFEDIGTQIDPYIASISMAVIRAIMSVIFIWLTKRYNRRTLALVSTAGMATCIAISGYFTKLIGEGRSSQSAIPISMILLYTFSTTLGFLSIPALMMAELFPLSVRGMTHSITFGFFNIGLFISIQMYYDLKRLFGGSSGLQFLFAVVSIGAFVYCYVFLPETHNKKLSDIEEYFQHHTTFLSTGQKRLDTNKGKRDKKLLTK